MNIKKELRNQLLEHTQGSDISFKPFVEDEDEDRFGMYAVKDGKIIGQVIGEEIMDAYQYHLDDVMDEDEYYEIFGDERVIKVEHIEVDDKLTGVGTMLMDQFMRKCSNDGYRKYFLNASPMGFDGLDLRNLIMFYRKYGFEVFKNQGNNAIMIKK